MRKRTLLCMIFTALSIASAPAQEAKFPRYNFDIGGGYGLGRGDVSRFVGDSYQIEAGAGMNFNRMFGFNAEYMYYNLDLKQSVANSQSINKASGYMNSWSLDGLVRSPVHLGDYGAYGIFGVGFYQRIVNSTTGTVPAGATCQPAWVWWDIYCVNGFVLTSQSLRENTKVAGGFNFGGGITYRLHRWHNASLFAEFRYHRAYTSDTQTSVMPISAGFRW
ncbi:MAG TPA: outer membrane beta-barrel protein [Terriglobales bacterium]|nr:outer membrane beta-barrel protein [Terriglobales bacterium]